VIVFCWALLLTCVADRILLTCVADRILLTCVADRILLTCVADRIFLSWVADLTVRVAGQAQPFVLCAALAVICFAVTVGEASPCVFVGLKTKTCVLKARLKIKTCVRKLVEFVEAGLKIKTSVLKAGLNCGSWIEDQLQLELKKTWFH
jgi:hypothetical protein